MTAKHLTAVVERGAPAPVEHARWDQQEGEDEHHQHQHRPEAAAEPPPPPATTTAPGEPGGGEGGGGGGGDGGGGLGGGGGGGDGGARCGGCGLGGGGDGGGGGGDGGRGGCGPAAGGGDGAAIGSPGRLPYSSDHITKPSGAPKPTSEGAAGPTKLESTKRDAGGLRVHLDLEVEGAVGVGVRPALDEVEVLRADDREVGVGRRAPSAATPTSRVDCGRTAGR